MSDPIDAEFAPELLNAALELATEWGDNFCKPINERILVNYPDLTESDIEQLTAITREAESYIYTCGERELAGEITEGDIVPEARRKYAWLDSNNASRLKNIGMFYARK